MIAQEILDHDPSNTFYRRQLAVELGNVGNTMLDMNDKTGALDSFRQALAIYGSMVAADPNDADIRKNSAVGYRNVATALGTGNRIEAVNNFHKALQIFAALVAKDAAKRRLSAPMGHDLPVAEPVAIASERFEQRGRQRASGHQDRRNTGCVFANKRGRAQHARAVGFPTGCVLRRACNEVRRGQAERTVAGSKNRISKESGNLSGHEEQRNTQGRRCP